MSYVCSTREHMTDIDPATGSLSAIDLAICDPAIYLQFNWSVYNDTVVIIFPSSLKNNEMINEHPPR